MIWIKLLLLILFPLKLMAVSCNSHLLKADQQEVMSREYFIEEMLTFYPKQEKSIMLSRLQSAKDEHKFLRSFIPFYYKRLFELRDKLPIHMRLKRFIGEIAGDAHVENFGFLIDDAGKSVFVMNDLDDVTIGPLYLDIVRLLHSSSLTSEEINFSKLLKAYKKGLKDDDYEFSDHIKELKQRSKDGGAKPLSKYIDPDKSLKFIKKYSPATDVTKKEFEDLQATLTAKLGSKSKLLDAYGYAKDSGGSAFGQRYHLMIEIDGKYNFVELKSIQDSGVVEFAKKIKNDKRILEGRDTFLSKDFNRSLDVVSFQGEDYQLRFRYEGNESITVDEIKSSQLDDVIKDEFFTLGQMHRKSLKKSSGDIEDYLKQLEDMSDEDWEKSVSLIRNQMHDDFKVLKQKQPPRK